MSTAGENTIRIEPLTRLEGHGRIDIVLDEAGAVAEASFVAVEFRGFERFCVGRPVEEMPHITSRICGVCPTAHHLASTRALDEIFQVSPPPAAAAIRELVYYAFLLEDHLLHFFVLAGPDLLLDRATPAARRSILGLIEQLGQHAVEPVVAARKAARALVEQLGGRAIHPVLGVPGGVSRGPAAETRLLAARCATLGRIAVEGGLALLRERLQPGDPEEQQLRTYYMGLIDERGRCSFLDGRIRVVGPDGAAQSTFAARDYREHLAEHVLPTNYLKMTYLRHVGWRGLEDGARSGIYRVGPLARLNVADCMASARAEDERQALFSHFGGRPVHDMRASGWARLVECLQACDRIEAISAGPALDDPCLRHPLAMAQGTGIAAIEAPRGTLIHDYRCDKRGTLEHVNLLVATQHNVAAINLAVTQAARAVVIPGEIPQEPLLNEVEAAFRPYDPCLGCATHTLAGPLPVSITVRGPGNRVLRQLRRGV